MNNRERIEKAILMYEGAIKDALKSERRIFLVSLVSPVVLAVAAFVSVIRSDLSALIASVGVGGANLAVIYGTIGKEIKAFLRESSSLRLSVKRLKMELTLCGEVDRDCMKKVEQMLRGYFKALEKE